MPHRIQEIEGIGPAYSQKLAECQIKTTEGLLETCRNPQGRHDLSERTGVTESLILKWVNMADLMRVNGVGGEYAELLHAAGVDTVKELRNRNANALAGTLQEINNEKHLTRTVPSEKTVRSWIEQAKGLNPMVTH